MTSSKPTLASLEEEFGSALFPRGFLLSSGPVTTSPAHWVTVPIDPTRWLAHDPSLRCESAEDGDSTVVVLGNIYSLDDPSAGGRSIASVLARKLRRSRRAFYTSLDHLHGRFTLIYRRSAEQAWCVTTDATGMRATYFAMSQNAGHAAQVGSHPALVAAHVGAAVRPPTVTGFGMPGMTTAFEGVFLLPPNQELRTADGSLHRYWPRRRIVPMSSRGSARRVAALLRTSLVSILADHSTVLASITAGVDSRATLATVLTTQNVDRVTWFTYVRDGAKWTDRADKRISVELAAHYNLNHLEVDLTSLPETRMQWQSLITTNAGRAPTPLIERALASHATALPSMHLRSNLSEIGRAFYVRKRPLPKPKNGADLAEIYRYNVRATDPHIAEWQGVVEAFDDFYRRTGFGRAARLIDGRDLFYWEHRMGAWHGQSILETDVAYDSLSLYNSRAVITALLGPSLRARMEDRHLKALFAAADPYLATVPINPGPAKYKKELPPTRLQRLRKGGLVRGIRRKAGRIRRLLTRRTP